MGGIPEKAMRCLPKRVALLIFLGFGTARAGELAWRGIGARADESASLGARIGLAVKHVGEVCFSIRNAHLPVHANVSLVTPTLPQSIAAAVIVGSGPGCAGMKDSATIGYRLRITGGKVANNLVLIGVTGAASLSLHNGEHVVGDLEQNGTTQTFRSCTSADGVHLTVWQDVPLNGRRLWQAYYYIGQDLEPTCTGKDIAE